MKTSIAWSPAAGLNVLSVERCEHAWTVTVESRRPTPCPGCGAQSKSRHGTYWRTLRDLSAQGAPVVVNARLGRWRCRNRLQGPVTTPRIDTHYVVTEFGSANLKGLSSTERAHALIGLAHPEFRDELLASAKKLHLV